MKTEENIVRCDLRVFHVSRAQAGSIIVIVGLGTMLAWGCAICCGAGSGAGTRVRKPNSGS